MADHFPGATGEDFRLLVVMLALETEVISIEAACRLIGETSCMSLARKRMKIRQSTRNYIDFEKRRLGVL